MSNLIVFDFDGTLADITELHKQAWHEVIQVVGLHGELAAYLPYERFLLERFDSADRIRKSFFASDIDRLTLEFFFNTKDAGTITARLLDLKESHLLHLLDIRSPLEVSRLYAKNIFQAIDMLLGRQYKLGIISSTRESVIIKTLRNYKLDECFSFIIGEESMKDGKTELRKYDARVRDKIPRRLLAEGKEQPYYIGDDARMDSLLARNYGFKFLQIPRQADFLLLKEWL